MTVVIVTAIEIAITEDEPHLVGATVTFPTDLRDDAHEAVTVTEEGTVPETVVSHGADAIGAAAERVLPPDAAPPEEAPDAHHYPATHPQDVMTEQDLPEEITTET